MNNHRLMNSLKLFVFTVIGLCILCTASFAQVCSFAGSWNSNYGKLVLNQSGSKITGTFGSNGYISGTVQGYILQALWSNGRVYRPGEDGGQVNFYISPDCSKLHGDWRDGDETTGLEWHKGGWQATKIGQGSYVTQPRKPDSVQRSGGYGLPTYNNGGNNNAYNILCNWDGTWSTKWGNVKLWQTGPSTVEGTYAHKGGRLKGTISGNKYTGTWSQSPSYSAPNDAGQFSFTISTDCRSYSGSWRYGYNQHGYQWSNDWNGTKY